MKSICKKMMITLLTVMLVVNFIMNPFCFAGSDVVRNLISDILGTFVGILTWPIRILALGIGYAMDSLATGIAYVDGTVGTNVDKQNYITPFEIVFNETAITNVDFFDFTSVGSDTVVYKIRTAVAGWYYFMRLIAIAILLVILVYVGIRMAISTVADDKAKYKKMLVDWLASLALVFVLQYIMVFMIEISNAVVRAMSASRPAGLEDTLNGIAVEALGLSIESFGSTVVFFLFVFQTFSILFSYINRMIRVAFLIVISPLITITYSIDKMGDGKAQAFNMWFKEYIFNLSVDNTPIIAFEDIKVNGVSLAGFKPEKTTYVYEVTDGKKPTVSYTIPDGLACDVLVNNSNLFRVVLHDPVTEIVYSIYYHFIGLFFLKRI